MYSFYENKCKQCEYFWSSNNVHTYCSYQASWGLTDSNVGQRFFLYYFQEALLRCPYFNVGQSGPKLEKYKNILSVLYALLLFGGITMVLLLSYNPDIAGVFMITYIVPLLGFLCWITIKKEYEKSQTKEEIIADKKALLDEWTPKPIKSAHIIRLERGLYTGLGNRRPYPHGRRTKKY